MDIPDHILAAAKHKARTDNCSVSIRLNNGRTWTYRRSVAALAEDAVEVATVHQDGRVDYVEEPKNEDELPQGIFKEDGEFIGMRYTATDEEAMALIQDVVRDDGRSNFYWITIDSDWLLACYPQGDTAEVISQRVLVRNADRTPASAVRRGHAMSDLAKAYGDLTRAREELSQTLDALKAIIGER